MNDSIVDRLHLRNETAIRQALREVGQNRVAELIGVANSTMADFKEHIPRFAAMLAACGLRVVPSSNQSYSEEYISALRVLAKAGLHSGAGLGEED